MILGEEDLGDAMRVLLGNGSKKAVIPGIEKIAPVSTITWITGTSGSSKD
jgi:hypothetical protein